MRGNGFFEYAGNARKFDATVRELAGLPPLHSDLDEISGNEVVQGMIFLQGLKRAIDQTEGMEFGIAMSESDLFAAVHFGDHIMVLHITGVCARGGGKSAILSNDRTGQVINLLGPERLASTASNTNELLRELLNRVHWQFAEAEEMAE